MYCAQCGEAIEVGGAFCSRCGTAVDSNIDVTSYQNPIAQVPEKRAFPAWATVLIVTGILLLLAACCAAGVFAFSDDIREGLEAILLSADTNQEIYLPMSRDEVEMGSVETDVFVGIWDKVDSFDFLAPTEWFKFTESGMFEFDDGDRFRGMYSPEEMEEGIFRMSLLHEASFEAIAEQSEWRQELAEDYLRVTFDFSGFDASSIFVAFHKERHEFAMSPNYWFGYIEDGLMSVEARGYDLTENLFVDFSEEELEHAILDVIEQGYTVGEIQAQATIRTHVDGSTLSSDQNQMITFSLAPFTATDFVDWYSVTYYARLDGDSLREFASLEHARANRDEDLLWAATRR